MSKATFAELAKRNRRKPRFARQPTPNNIRREYYAKLNAGPLKDMQALVARLVISKLPELTANASRLSQDSLHEDARLLNRAMQAVKDAFSAMWPNRALDKIAMSIGKATDKFQRRQINLQMKAIVGVDVLTEPEPWLAAAIKEFSAENIALIRSVPEQYFSQVETIVTRGVADGVRHEQIAKQLVERGGVAESRAALIARDQVGKLYGDLNRVRQQDLGLTEFVWRTVRDNRVREEHEALDGQTFEWKSPPSEGTPGEPINCRCYAEPVIPGL